MRRRYDATADLYDRRYRRIQREKFHSIVNFLEGHKRILDVGCGTGLILPELAPSAEIIVGIDLSPDMLSRAKERAGNVALISADADWLPFRDESFDATLAVTLLQNMPAPMHTVHELVRVTEFGGIVVMTSLRHKHSSDQLEFWAKSANLKPLQAGKISDSEDVFCVARRVG